MAEPLPLVFLEGEADGYCDAETGVCAPPAALTHPDDQLPPEPQPITTDE